HYVLIGGVAFPIFAGVYYWWPKFTGKMLDERLGKINFWLLFVGVNVAFWPMHRLGMLGMPRRVYTYEADQGWDLLNLISTIGVFIIFAGIGVFILNLWKSWRHGETAGHNPWGADSLEWATASPPVEHGWSIVPIIRSRHPLWEQRELERGEEKVERFVHAFAGWPLKWRAALVVGTADARPQEIFRVANPSIWPLVASIGVVIIFLAELTKIRWGAAGGLLLMIIGVIAWNWPEEPPMTLEEEDEFEREHGVPVNAEGSVVIARWGTGLTILFVVICFASLLLAYFYLRLENPQWPPAGVPLPGLLLPALAGGTMIASATVLYGGLRQLRGGNDGRFMAALVGTMLLGVAGLVVQLISVSRYGIGLTDHAYGSMVMTLNGFLVGAFGAAVIMLGATLVWTVRGIYTSGRYAPVVNIARFWAAMTTMWVVGYAVLHLGPHLT
ncbi:MAG: cbb3-type cytochrome c oxidase subunit I, partial [Nitriliruptorales bacterium]|nr:cbb3-type cytochrome c oxidase subunit I [Nitriliruptorales bacterium]